jgi:hypothetical protein
MHRQEDGPGEDNTGEAQQSEYSEVSQEEEAIERGVLENVALWYSEEGNYPVEPAGRERRAQLTAQELVVSTRFRAIVGVQGIADLAECRRSGKLFGE